MNPDDIIPEGLNDEEISWTDDGQTGGEKKKFELPAEGKHVVIVKGFKLKKSKKLLQKEAESGAEFKKDQVEFEFTIGDYVFKEWMSLNPTALWKLTSLVRAIDPSQSGTFKLNKAHVSRRFHGTVKHEVSQPNEQGKTFTNVKIVKYEVHPDGPEVEEDDDLPF